MTAPACPVGGEELLGYLLGELDDDAAAAVEDHVFACARCARDLDAADLVRRSVRDAARGAALAGCVDAAFLARAARDGLTLHEYRLAPGRVVPCRPVPDDLVVLRLAAGAAITGGVHLEGTMEDLAAAATTPLPTREVFVDPTAAEVVLVFPGAAVRALPRSRWTYHLRLDDPTAPTVLGPYVLDHTP